MKDAEFSVLPDKFKNMRRIIWREGRYCLSWCKVLEEPKRQQDKFGNKQPFCLLFVEVKRTEIRIKTHTKP